MRAIRVRLAVEESIKRKKEQLAAVRTIQVFYKYVQTMTLN